ERGVALVALHDALVGLLALPEEAERGELRAEVLAREERDEDVLCLRLAGDALDLADVSAVRERLGHAHLRGGRARQVREEVGDLLRRGERLQDRLAGDPARLPLLRLEERVQLRDDLLLRELAEALERDV